METCTPAGPAGPNAAECGAGQHLMGKCGCGRVDTRVCGMRENKGVLTLGNLNRVRVRLTPKARFVWLVSIFSVKNNSEQWFVNVDA